MVDLGCGYLVSIIHFANNSMARGLDPADIGMVSHNIQTVVVNPGPALTSISFAVGGNLTAQGTTSISPAINTTLEWLKDVAASVGADWDLRATLTAGSTPTTGTMNTWLNLGTARSWTNLASGNDVIQTSTITFDFAPTGETTPLVTVTGTILYSETFTV